MAGNQLAAKLGRGSSSTVWLARNLNRFLFIPPTRPAYHLLIPNLDGAD
jgi:hypothetical protein